MGIQLGPLLETRKIKVDELSGQKVAIDGYNVLYQFLTSIRQKMLSLHGCLFPRIFTIYRLACNATFYHKEG